MNKLVLFIALSIFTFSACSDKEGVPDIDENGNLSSEAKARLLDKIWYPTSSAGGLELQFLSDGEFRQALSLSGSWAWRAEGNRMDITDYQGKKFIYEFDEITSSQMTFRTNLGGDNFKTPSVYRDTK